MFINVFIVVFTVCINKQTNMIFQSYRLNLSDDPCPYYSPQNLGCLLKAFSLVDRKSEDNDGEETWQFNHRYWEVRKTPGFVSLNIEPLW